MKTNLSRRRFGLGSAALALAAGTTACGGGGGNDTAAVGSNPGSPSPAAPPAGNTPPAPADFPFQGSFVLDEYDWRVVARNLDAIYAA